MTWDLADVGPAVTLLEVFQRLGGPERFAFHRFSTILCADFLRGNSSTCNYRALHELRIANRFRLRPADRWAVN